MSIIYEALKKVESSPANSISQLKLKSDAKNASVKPSKKINLTVYALVGLCVISTVFIALSAYFSNRNSQSEAVKSYLAKKEIGKNNNAQQLPATGIKEEKLGPDKTQSLNPSAKALPKEAGTVVYSLQGIVYDENSPFAVINGKTVRKSDAIDDYVVIDIVPTIVTLKNSKTDKELNLSF